MALVVAMRQIPQASPMESRTGPALLAAAMSNQNLAAYVSHQAEQGWNQPAATFRWTNLGESLYSTSFPSKGKNNQ
jgi:hypothetical protein